MGVLLIGFLANEEYINLFPTSGLESLRADRWTFLPVHTESGWQHGYLLDLLWHLILPVLCLSYTGFAFLTKLTRSSVLENLQADYARTARAKGLSARAILFRHALKPAMLPVISYLGPTFVIMITGSVVIDLYFTTGGIGQAFVNSALNRDYSVMMGITILIGCLTILFNLVVDILYAWIDPKIKL